LTNANFTSLITQANLAGADVQGLLSNLGLDAYYGTTNNIVSSENSRLEGEIGDI